MKNTELNRPARLAPNADGTVRHDGVTFTFDPEAGSFYQTNRNDVGTLYMPADVDGNALPDDLAEILKPFDPEPQEAGR